MPYPYDVGTLAAINRLGTFYNGGNYNAGSNPGGFGQGGHITNFIPSLQDLATVGDSVADAADAADVFADAAAASAVSASNFAAQLQGTSTTGVSIGTGSKSFTTQASKQFNVGTYVFIVSDADPTTHFMEGQVTAYDSGTGALTINSVVSGGSGTRSDWTIYGRVGTPGVTGPTGATGPQGQTPAFQWNFSNGTADTDPGNGNFAFNNATPTSATLVFIDNLDRNSATQTAFLDSLDDSTNTSSFGMLTVMSLTGAAYALFKVTGAIVDGTGYRKVPVTPIMSFGSFSNGAAHAISFSPSGDKGVDGLGAGDVISDISSTTSGFVVIFNGTTAKHVTSAGGGIGTTGHNLGWLDGANTWSGTQSLNATLDAQQQFRLSGDITPTQITSQQNDYAPTGNATASVWRLSTDATRVISGFSGGADGRILVTPNVGSNHIEFANITGSSAANQLSIGADIRVPGGQAAVWIYDSTSTKWRPLFFTGLAGDGTVTRPFYTFASDPDSGLYRIGANNIAFAVNGVKALDIAPSAWGFSGPSAPIFTLTNNTSGTTYTFVTADRDYFIKTSGSGGSDAADGLTLGTAWATLQKAADVLATLYIPAGIIVDFFVSDGTYTGPGTPNAQAFIKGWAGGGAARFIGNLTTPANVVLSNANFDVFQIVDGALIGGGLSIRGFRMGTGSSTLGGCVYHLGNGKCFVETCEFNTCQTAMIANNPPAFMAVQGNHAIVASATMQKFLDADEACIQVSTGTITIGSSVTIAQALGNARFGGHLVCQCTWAGSTPTGKRFSASEGGRITTQNAGLSYFPGTVAGSIADGGSYDGIMNIRGTPTNDNAPAGYVGEVIESIVLSGSAVSLTASAATTVTSISLTAGDWDVYATGHFLYAGTTTVTGEFVSISETTNALDQAPGRVDVWRNSTGENPAGNTRVSGAVTIRKLFASTTTVYIVLRTDFTGGGTCGGFGIIWARRRR